MRYIESINSSLHSLFEEDDKVVLLGEDILDPYGGAFKASKGLSEKFPDRVISTPISEAAFTGMGVGMALQGMKPIVEIMFGDFITLCTDQIVNGAVKFPLMYGKHVPLHLTIRTPMGARRGYGPTHSQTLESIFLSIPNIRIVAPSHFHIPGLLLIDSVYRDGVDLFIENKALYAEKLWELSNGLSSQINVLKDKDHTIATQLKGTQKAELAIIGYGGMSPLMLEAMKRLFVEQEIVCKLILPAQIKPLNLDTMIGHLTDVSSVLIIEEACSNFNWSAEVAFQIYSNCPNVKKVERLGAKDYPIPNALPLENSALVQVSDIITAVLKMV